MTNMAELNAELVIAKSGYEATASHLDMAMQGTDTMAERARAAEIMLRTVVALVFPPDERGAGAGTVEAVEASIAAARERLPDANFMLGQVAMHTNNPNLQGAMQDGATAFSDLFGEGISGSGALPGQLHKEAEKVVAAFEAAKGALHNFARHCQGTGQAMGFGRLQAERAAKGIEAYRQQTGAERA